MVKPNIIDQFVPVKKLETQMQGFYKFSVYSVLLVLINSCNRFIPHKLVKPCYLLLCKRVLQPDSANKMVERILFRGVI